MQSPCLILSGREGPCEFLHRDKNHADCVDCDLRIKYAVNQNMLSPEVLEVKDDPVIIEARRAAPKKKRKHCKDCGRPKPIKARGRCSTCYVRWRYHNADKVRGYRKICNDCGLKQVHSKGLCNNCYGRAWYKNIHKMVRGYRRKGKEMNDERDKV